MGRFKELQEEAKDEAIMKRIDRIKTYIITEPSGQWDDYVYRFIKPLDGIGQIIFRDRTARTNSHIIADYFRKIQRYKVEEC